MAILLQSMSKILVQLKLETFQHPNYSEVNLSYNEDDVRVVSLQLGEIESHYPHSIFWMTGSRQHKYDIWILRRRTIVPLPEYSHGYQYCRTTSGENWKGLPSYGNRNVFDL